MPEKDQKIIEFSQQRASHIIAGLLVCAFFIFIAGYYWGKKTSIETLTEQLVQDSLADKMLCAFCCLNDESDNKAATIETETQDDTSKIAQEAAQPDKNQSPKLYYAQLAGFGSLKAAKKCEADLHRNGYNVKSVERHSQTAKGQTRTWYQLVTENESNKEILIEKVDRIKRLAKLQGVKIVTCDNPEYNKISESSKERLTA